MTSIIANQDESNTMNIDSVLKPFSSKLIDAHCHLHVNEEALNRYLTAG